MAKFIVKMVDLMTGDIEVQDEVFDNEEDAEEYASLCSGAFAEGADVLSMSGRDYTPAEEVDFVVDEIEE